MKSMKKLVLVGLVLLASVMVLLPLVGCDTNAGWESSIVASVMIGDSVVEYESFDEALSSAMQNDGSILTLLANMSSSSRIDIASGNFTFDLNGKTITYPGQIFVNSEATLIITDSSQNKRGTIICTSNDYGTDVVLNEGNLTVNGGTLSATSEECRGVTNRGELTVYGGTISAVHGLFNEDSGNATVSGGTIKGSRTGVCNLGNFFLSGNPSITSNEHDFMLENYISIVGNLTGSNTYSVFWPEDEVGTSIIVGGSLTKMENYHLSDNDAKKFVLTYPENRELVLDSSQNALVLKETTE